MNSDWEPTTLVAVSDSVDYGYTASASVDAAGPLFLRITDIVGGTVDWSSVPRCTISEQKLAKYRLQVGDIVIARTGASAGETYCIRSAREAVFASYLVRFRLDIGQAVPEFIRPLLRSPSWWRHVRDSVGGSAQPQLNA